MKNAFILIYFLALPFTAGADCFKYDIQNVNLENPDHPAFKRILLMSDYSECSNQEIPKMIEGIKSFAQHAVSGINSGGSTQKLVFLGYLSNAKASLALLLLEQSKRK